MDIGRPKRIIEIEPATLPLPDPFVPMPEVLPPTPEPSPEPAMPEPAEPQAP